MSRRDAFDTRWIRICEAGLDDMYYCEAGVHTLIGEYLDGKMDYVPMLELLAKHLSKEYSQMLDKAVKALQSQLP